MTQAGANLANAMRSHRYAMLFLSLLLTIAAGPLLEALDFGREAMELFLAVNLLAAVVPIGMVRQRRALYALVGIAIVLRRFSADHESPAIPVLAAAIWGLVAVVAAYRAIRYSLSSVQVTGEHLYAALSAYLLIGLCWGVVYTAIARTDPGALLIGGAPFPRGVSMGDAIYFSFVTLATLGFGDITPATAVMRGLVVFEAVIGQFYLAIMVARLVGLQTAIHTR